MIEIIDKIRGWLSLVGPVVVFLAATISTYGILKWGTKTVTAFKEIFKDPLKVIFFLVVLALFMYAYFTYLKPYL